jgi:hypothetical protein
MIKKGLLRPDAAANVPSPPAIKSLCDFMKRGFASDNLAMGGTFCATYRGVAKSEAGSG